MVASKMQNIPIAQCAPLASVQHHLSVGRPLPFNIRGADGTLLLARGHVLPGQRQLDALLERGTLVDVEELQAQEAQDIRDTPIDRLPVVWGLCFQRVRTALSGAGGPAFKPAMESAALTTRALIDRDPDLAIFQLLRHDQVDASQGFTRTVHAATAAQLAAHTLGWSEDDSYRAFKAALTMNVSMLDLQGQLAMQMSPLTTLQRRNINEHPERSRDLLLASGVNDIDWLTAIEQHHEDDDGSGYPAGITDRTTLATLLRTADVYTSMLSVRSTRRAVRADTAARKLYAAQPSNPMAAALIKAFGLYPPGCHVRLTSGELAVVLERGGTANAPLVAALTMRDGMPRPDPLLLDTGNKAHAVSHVVDDHEVRVRIPTEQLLALR